MISKNNTASFLLTLFMAISLTGCSNDDSTSNENQNLTDNQNLIDNKKQNLTGDYWPTSVDNAWVYTQGTKEISTKIAETEDINGYKYYKFNQLNIFGRATNTILSNNPPVSIKKNKGDYYIKVDEMNTTVGGVTYKSTGYEFLFFKDYLDVNQTWTGTYNYIESNNAISYPLYARTEGTYTGEILEKGISLTVNGTVFKDVIKFRFTQILDGKDDAWPIWDYSSDYWIAKDVGIIKFSNDGIISEHKSHIIK